MHIYFKEEMFSYKSLTHTVTSTKYVKVTAQLLVSLQHGSTLTNIRWAHNTTCTGTPHSFISDLYKQQLIVFRQFKLFQNSKFPSFANYIIFLHALMKMLNPRGRSWQFVNSQDSSRKFCTSCWVLNCIFWKAICSYVSFKKFGLLPLDSTSYSSTVATSFILPTDCIYRLSGILRINIDYSPTNSNNWFGPCNGDAVLPVRQDLNF
jgi:hypothetical protein